MYGYIYETINLVNGKKYIGKHKSDSFDEQYFGSGILIKSAIAKYGRNNFTCSILESADNLEELNSLEKEYITKFNAVASNDYYNIASGGNGGDTYSGLSPDNKQLFSDKIKSRCKDEAYSKNLSTRMHLKWQQPDYKVAVSNKISESLKGKTKSEIHRKHISETRKEKKLFVGYNNYFYGSHRTGSLNPTYGFHYYNNGVNEVYVSEKLFLDNYKSLGFVKGRLPSNIHRLHESNKGRVRIYKEGIQKRVKPEDLNQFIADGWSTNK